MSKRLIVLFHDLIMTVLAVYGAFFLRFSESQFLLRVSYLTLALPFILVSAAAIYSYAGLYRGRWRFASIPDLVQIVHAVLGMAVLMLAVDYVLVSQNFYGTFFVGKVTIILYALLQGVLLGMPRLAFRYWRYHRTMGGHEEEGRIQTLILGKDNEAASVLQAIEMQSLRGIAACGVVTLRPSQSGEKLRGVSILGSVAQIEAIVDRLSERGITIGRLIATESALTPEAEPDKLLAAARRLGLPIWRMQHVLEDEASSARLAPLDIEALLFRDSVKIDRARLTQLIAGKRVAITGGGGSIGGELSQRIAALGASHVMIIENSEPMLHQILEQLERQTQNAQIEGVLADIRDGARMDQVLRDFRPDLVLHAAALKQVPYLEAHWGEAIKTNIFGSRNVLQAASLSGAQAVVMISTDKAIDPVSVLGVTKRFAELYAQMLDEEIKAQRAAQPLCRVISVRFGNVLGSNGSVIPKFRAQIAAGGPVTVTDPDMVRYFMTVREASELVLSAASHALETRSDPVTPSVYVLKMGQQVRILDLAQNLIRLSGFEPDVDIPIVFTGVRPGERLHEIMFDRSEEVSETSIDGVLAAAPHSASRQQMQAWLERLEQAVARLDRQVAEQVFYEAVPNFKPADRPVA